MIKDDITLILVLATILVSSPFLSKVLRLPTSIIEISIGSLLVTTKFIEKNQYFDIIAEVGFLYLMFLAGMEVHLNNIINAPKALLQRSVAYIFLLGFLSIAVGFLLNLNFIFIISIPLISLGLVATLAKNYGKEHKWLQIAFIVGVIGEIASIITITVLDVITKVGFKIELLEELAILFGFIIFIYILYKLIDLLFWWYPELKEKLMPKVDNSEQDIRFSMALFFIFIVLMIRLHLELALGAFIAGVAISAFFHHKKDLEEKMSSFGFGFLVPLFFIHVGTTLDLGSLRFHGVLPNAIILVVLSLGIKVFSAYVLKPYANSLEAVLVGLSLSMPLTLLVALATIGYKIGILTLLNYYSLILASVLEIIVAMLLIGFLVKKKKKYKEQEKK